MPRLSLPLLAALLALCGVLLLGAFLWTARGDGPGLSLPGFERDLEVTTADQLDSLAAAGGPVSVTGTVVEESGDGSPLLLDDGTGLVAVALPDTPPGLTGHRLFARGPLVERDGQLVLEAVEWLYDSTAVRVHSE